MPIMNQLERAWGHSRGGAVAPAAALMLGVMAPALASANPITAWTINAYVTTDAGGNPMSLPVPYEQVGGSETYTGNYPVFPITSHSPQIDDPGCCSNLEPVPSQPSLTSATLGIASTNSSTGVVADANSYANLSTGSVGVSGSSNQVGVSGGDSQSVALLEDALTFHILGATASTVTDIGVRWSISGGVSSGINGDAEMMGHLTFGNAEMGTEWASDAGVVSNGDGTSAIGWQSADTVSNSASSTIVNGEYQLVGPDPTLPLELLLECGTDNDSSCDYFDTESLSFTLPTGVTYTSASGAFLNQSAASVPEPGSFLLFSSALLALGWNLRRSKPRRMSGALMY